MRNDRDDMLNSQVSREILAYLVEHPDARETLEGVAEWWLPEQKTRHQTSVVKEALSSLVEEGLLIEKGGQGTSPSYHINPDKLQEAKEILRRGA